MGLLGQITNCLVIIIFCSSGVLKVTDKIHAQSHQYLRKEFTRFVKVHPFAVYFDYHMEPFYYMKVIGCVQVLSSLLLLLGPRSLKVLSSLACMVVIYFEIFSMYMLNYPWMILSIPIASFVLVFVNLLLIEEDKLKVN